MASVKQLQALGDDVIDVSSAAASGPARPARPAGLTEFVGLDR
jgi:hypothetical protein